MTVLIQVGTTILPPLNEETEIRINSVQSRLIQASSTAKTKTKSKLSRSTCKTKFRTSPNHLAHLRHYSKKPWSMKGS